MVTKTVLWICLVQHFIGFVLANECRSESPDGLLCLSPYSLTKYSRNENCYWDPTFKDFMCKVEEKDSMFVESCSSNCDFECQEHFWKCKKDCIPITEPCEEECFPVSECDSYLSQERQRDCKKLIKPTYRSCENKCQPMFSAPEETWLCNGKCQHWEEPCNGECIHSTWKINNKTGNCDFVKTIETCSEKDIDCAQRCPPGMVKNCLGDCEIRLSFHPCSDECTSVTKPCNGQCFHQNLTQNCQGLCEVPPMTFHLCNNECQNSSLTCDGECTQGYYFNCEGICEKNPLTYTCNNKCQSIEHPCNGTCLKTNQINCGGKCVDIFGQNVWDCNGQCQDVYIPCDGKCPMNYWKCPNADKCVFKDYVCTDKVNQEHSCPGNLEHSRMICENDDQHLIEKDCTANGMIACQGFRHNQCIELEEVCDKSLDCIDRSDEQFCDASHGVVDYSIFHECIITRNNSFQGGGIGTRGFKCDEFCIEKSLWCKNENSNIGPVQLKYLCYNLWSTFHNENLCRNHTFWQNHPCGGSLHRCRGNYPGKCIKKSNSCQVRNAKPECTDFSDLVCSNEDLGEHIFNQVCSGKNMIMCKNNSTCVHEELVCDGYIHCPDESDEDQEKCSVCPRSFGYPVEKRTQATFQCIHKYTNRFICAVPCDDKDDLCLDLLDEECEYKSFKYSFLVTFVYILFFLSIGVGKLIYHFERKKYISEIELKSHYWALHDFLQEILSKTERNANKVRTFNEFVRLHNAEQYGDQLTLVCNILLPKERELKKPFAKTLYHMELSCHHGNAENVHFCIKRHLGSSEKSKLFYSLIEEDHTQNHLVELVAEKIPKVKSRFSKLRPKRPTMNRSMLMSFGGTATLLQMVSYNVDVIKDVFFILLYILFYASSISLFFSFQFQILFLFCLSIAMPCITNTTLLFQENPLAGFKSIFVRVAFACLSPVSGAIGLYLSSKYTQERDNLLIYFREASTTEYYEERLSYIESCTKKWNTLVARLRSNDNAFENFVQATLLLVIAMLKFTQTNTVSGFQKLLAGDNLELIIIFASMSLVQIVLGNLKFFSLDKEEAMTIKGKLILAVFAMLSLVARISALVFYFAPSLGLMNLLAHWKYGKMKVRDNSAEIFDVTDNGNFVLFADVWKQVDHYTDMTVFSLGTYYQVFVGFIVAHYVQVFIIKYIYALDFSDRKQFFVKMFHVLTQFACPFVFKDWDDKVTGSADSFENWALISKEMKWLLVLFTAEHIFLCLPIFILTFNIYARNQFLKPFFPLLEEEIYSTNMAYSIAVIAPIIYLLLPLLQYYLFILYHKIAHPWSRIFLNHYHVQNPVIADPELPKNSIAKIQLGVPSSDDPSETYFYCFWNNVVKE